MQQTDWIMDIGGFRTQHHLTMYCQHSSALNVY